MDTQYFILRSADRASGTAENCLINLNDHPLKGAGKLELLHAVFTWEAAMAGQAFLMIKIPEFGLGNVLNANANAGATFFIPTDEVVSSAASAITYKAESQPPQITLHNSTIHQLHVQVCDQAGATITLSDNWTILLRIHHRK